MQELMNGTIQTMSSIQISELTNKNHSDVKKDIRRILEECEIDMRKFSHVSKNHQNQSVEVYNLPERECMLVVAGYSAKYRLAIIDEWRMLRDELEINPIVPKTFREALLLAAEQQEVIEKQALQIEVMEPKIIAFENVVDSANTYTLDSVSDILNIGRTTLCRMLEKKNWKTIKETNGTSSTRYAEENGYAKTIFEYIKINGKEIKTKRIVLKKKGLDILIKQH